MSAGPTEEYTDSSPSTEISPTVLSATVEESDVESGGRTRSFRQFWRGVRGTNVRANVNLPGVIRSVQEVVHVTAGEAVPLDPPSVITGPDGRTVQQNWRYILGAARVWVSNISPHGGGGDPGGVEFLLQVEWGSPLNIGVTVTVEGDTPFQINN